MIRTILADDHHLVRQGLRSLLEKQKEIRVVGEAENGLDAVRLVQSLKPDMVVMDLRMPRMDGAEAARQILTTCPDTRIVVLSMYGDESAVAYAFQNGASGYVLKTSVIEELVDAIFTVNSGEIYISPGLSLGPLGSPRIPIDPGFKTPLEKLSSREIQVLQYVADGYTSAQIARELGLSISTVEKHRLHVMDKLGIHDVPGLVRFAVKQGLAAIK